MLVDLRRKAKNDEECDVRGVDKRGGRFPACLNIRLLNLALGLAVDGLQHVID